MEISGDKPSRRRVVGISVGAAILVLCSIVILAPSRVSAATPSITVSPQAGIVGSTLTIVGTGFPPNTSVYVGWTSENASWIVQGIPITQVGAGVLTTSGIPQVTGVNSTPLVYKLGTTGTNSSGSFSVETKVPSDYGGAHAIQAYATNGTAISPVGEFYVVPHFEISPSSGPAGTPITITATGLGIGPGSTNYHLYWDNSYVGYMTAVTTGGSTNATFYASGTPGLHYISIYEGWPGPGYFNPAQGPVTKPGDQTVYYPPDIPFYSNFTVTPERVVPQGSTDSPASFHLSNSAATGSLAVLIGGVSLVAVFVSRTEPEKRGAISRMLVAGIIIALVVVAGVGVYVGTAISPSSASSSTSQSASGPTVTFTPVAVVDRPHITVPVLNNATSGPRISITPDLAIVGQNVTVNGLGFAPNAELPLVWTTRQGNDIYGYKLVSLPLRNVTADASGSFSFTMQVPSDLGGLHFIAAGNLTEHSNGTLYLERSAKLSVTQGPDGTKIGIILSGVGWDYVDNIATFDYDNSYVGYGCGFSSSGSVIFTIVATGPPGIHTIDVYPSIYWGPSNAENQQITEYRYPLLTPQDHPELVPAFHFTFLVTTS